MLRRVLGRGVRRLCTQQKRAFSHASFSPMITMKNSLKEYENEPAWPGKKGNFNGVFVKEHLPYVSASKFSEDFITLYQSKVGVGANPLLDRIVESKADLNLYPHIVGAEWENLGSTFKGGISLQELLEIMPDKDVEAKFIEYQKETLQQLADYWYPEGDYPAVMNPTNSPFIQEMDAEDIRDLALGVESEKEPMIPFRTFLGLCTLMLVLYITDTAAPYPVTFKPIEEKQRLQQNAIDVIATAVVGSEPEPVVEEEK